MPFELLLALAGAVAGGVASVAGFGIGSVLTPVLAVRVDTATAVAAVSLPHAVGTALRFWRLRAHVDRRVLAGFGVASAAGGLAGALLHARVGSPALAVVFGALLVFAGVSGLTGLTARMRLEGAWAWIAGVLSGVFGGMVGNQGGIRSAAMLGVHVPRDAFVATATAVALLVDAARLPVYLATTGPRLVAIWPWVAVATLAVVAGTLAGVRVLGRIPERFFRRLVAALVLALGVWTLVDALRTPG